MLRTSQKQVISEFNPDDHSFTDVFRRVTLRRAQAKNVLKYRRMKRWNKVIDWFLVLLAMSAVGFVLGQTILVGHLHVYHQPPQSWRDLQDVFFEFIHQICVYFNIQ